MKTINHVAALAMTAFAILHVAPAAAAEQDESQWSADCGGPYNLCGFAERVSREPRIPRIFERVMNFSEGVAGVRIDGKYGYVDRTGKRVIDPRFDLAGEFRNGHAEVVVGGHTGIIDRSGTFVLKPAYTRAIPFGRTAALVMAGTWRSSHALGYERLDTDYLQQDGGAPPYALIDLRTGATLQSGLRISAFDFDSFVWARRADGGPFGLMAPDGTWKLQPAYTEVNRLFGGRALVCISEGDAGARAEKSRCGSIDEAGNPALPMVPHKVVGYVNGLYRFFEKNRKTGLLDEQGRLVGGRLFDEIKFTDPGPVLEVKENGRWIGLTRQGETVENPANDKVLVDCPSGVQFLARDGGFQVTRNGKPTTAHVFDNTYPSKDCDFPKSVRLDGKYGFVGADGRLLLDPPSLDSAHGFARGHAGVMTGGKWGIMNTNGRFTVAPKYDALRPDDEGLYAVTLGEENFWIDVRGERRPEPNRGDERRKALTCGPDGGTVIGREVESETLWGLADLEGRVLVAPKYRAISCFENGLAWVPLDDRKMWCPIDRHERVREGVACVTNWKATRIFDAGPEKMSEDPYESGVLWMRAQLDYGQGRRDRPPRIVGNFGTTF